MEFNYQSITMEDNGIVTKEDNGIVTKEDNGIVTREYTDLGLEILKYNKESCDMSDSVARECRGMVREIESKRIVCLPPIKSLEMNDFFKDRELGDCLIEEFIDGTMINMFYYKEDWHISTRSSIGASCRWHSRKYFSEMFQESSGNLDVEKLNRDYYYSFVLRHPENRIVTNYTSPSIILVFVGQVMEDNLVHTIDVKTEAGRIGVESPTRYEFASTDDIKKYVDSQSFEFQGVVIKDGVFRTKYRNSAYNTARQLRGNTKNLKYIYFSLKKEGKLNEHLSFFPEHQSVFAIFELELEQYIADVHNSYMNYRVKKIFTNVNELEYTHRPHCYRLHGIFLESRNPITRSVVRQYLNNLEVPQIVFSLNYKYYSEE